MREGTAGWAWGDKPYHPQPLPSPPDTPRQRLTAVTFLGSAEAWELICFSCKVPPCVAHGSCYESCIGKHNACYWIRPPPLLGQYWYWRETMFWLCCCVTCHLFLGSDSLWGMAETSSIRAVSPLLWWRYHAPGHAAVQTVELPEDGHAGLWGAIWSPRHGHCPSAFTFSIGTRWTDTLWWAAKRKRRKASTLLVAAVSGWCVSMQRHKAKFLSPRFRKGNFCILNLVKIHEELMLKAFL